ncbi:hypothetical protein A2867_01450 [Candidatus Daviesbacteria bacterium RIFCSPHIGHO2_01_FULL_40_11]|uniref:Uncharacterized protein n=1 Tax=Candidatus Daviesbacteria bacterium RIFCSPHIGHO2_01_FULL_40_11 TaxID=1797762 RepID=A0A1F5JG76_9BACT|nr:MAG: hypothetical protein A2867_01450 [Candidatus Daviesbacteria bacterium RIFCSPHIGHO2_01_FULL_40_11]OGE62982.1 MAG: hypothetical protein A2964_02070 [Candidatus Daviesbacteria bacterium RIFCSPLOWO2_01_FULL_40_27]
MAEEENLSNLSSEQIDQRLEGLKDKPIVRSPEQTQRVLQKLGDQVTREREGEAPPVSLPIEKARRSVRKSIEKADQLQEKVGRLIEGSDQAVEKFEGVVTAQEKAVQKGRMRIVK